MLVNSIAERYFKATDYRKHLLLDLEIVAVESHCLSGIAIASREVSRHSFA